MGQKGLSRIARALAACGGGNQAETAKKSLEVPGKDPCDKRLSRFNSLYDDGAACAVGDSLTLVGLTLDEQKALEQQSYALETSKLDHPEGLTQHGGAHSAIGEGRAEGTPAPREVAVRCFLGDTRESAQDKPSLLATGIKHDPELMDDSLGDRDEYDNVCIPRLLLRSQPRADWAGWHTANLLTMTRVVCAGYLAATRLRGRGGHVGAIHASNRLCS